MNQDGTERLVGLLVTLGTAIFVQGCSSGSSSPSGVVKKHIEAALSSDKKSFLDTLAKSQAELLDFESAQGWATSLPTPKERAYAYLGVAEGLLSMQEAIAGDARKAVVGTK